MIVDMTMDGMWGSCGKGGISGYMAKRGNYDAVMCAYGTQAGHSYNDKAIDLKMMVQQLPVGIISKTVKRVFIGPGSLVHADVIMKELKQYGHYLTNARLMIHEHAAVVTDEHARREVERGQTKMGSTAKGVGQAMIDRILRDPDSKAVAKFGFKGTFLEQFVVNRFEYIEELAQCEEVLVEGAQGFGLSLYHGEWPFNTSRDVSPWQIAADCGLPFDCAPNINVVNVVRTRPIRVNNRDGSSGPAYPGQAELTWDQVGVSPELTTVTKLPRRIFEFSEAQIAHAAFHCGGSVGEFALTFADYCKTYEDLSWVMDRISKYGKIRYVCFGPDDSDVIDLSEHAPEESVYILQQRIEGA